MFTKNKVLTSQKATNKKKIKTSIFFVITFSGCYKIVKKMSKLKKKNH